MSPTGSLGMLMSVCAEQTCLVRSSQSSSFYVIEQSENNHRVYLVFEEQSNIKIRVIPVGANKYFVLLLDDIYSNFTAVSIWTKV